MASKKTYFPQKTFDDDLDAFAQLGSTHGWVFSGVDFDELKQDAIDQRSSMRRSSSTIGCAKRSGWRRKLATCASQTP